MPDLYAMDPAIVFWLGLYTGRKFMYLILAVETTVWRLGHLEFQAAGERKINIFLAISENSLSTRRLCEVNPDAVF